MAISRAAGTLTFPANFTLVAAQNPCPCGYYGDTERACVCPPSAVTRYSKRISGPLLDRIDIHVDVPRVAYDKLTSARLGEDSATIRARVAAARERQQARFAGLSGARYTNADMGAGYPRACVVREWCALDSAGQSLLRVAGCPLGVAVPTLGAGVSSLGCPLGEAGAHDRGRSGGRAYRTGTSGRGVAVSAEKSGVGPGGDGISVVQLCARSGLAQEHLR